MCELRIKNVKRNNFDELKSNYLILLLFTIIQNWLIRKQITVRKKKFF